VGCAIYEVALNGFSLLSLCFNGRCTRMKLVLNTAALGRCSVWIPLVSPY